MKMTTGPARASEHRSSCDAVLVMAPPWEPKLPPLGLAYVVEYAKSKGASIKVIDFNLQLYRTADSGDRIFWDVATINYLPLPVITERMAAVFQKQIADLVELVVSSNAKVVGFSVNVASIALAGKIATQIKQRAPRTLIIFGGTACYWSVDRRIILPEDLPSIDAFVIGEGEEAFAEILRRSPQSPRDLRGIPGVLWQQEFFLSDSEGAHVKDISTLPFPRFSDFDIGEYTDKRIPLVISRSCVGKCAFCIDHLMCGAYRYRSAKDVVEEIRHHVTTYKMTNFAFNDLACNGNPRQLEEICDALIRENLPITWDSYALIRKDMGLELFKKMRRAGCIWLCYGIESGSDSVLKRMNKYYAAADAQQMIRFTHEAGIKAAMNVIVGFPGETEAQFDETLSFIRNNREYVSEITNVSTFVVMPQSRLGRDASDYGLSLPKDGNLFCYTDENGLDAQGRARRLRKTLLLAAVYNIHNVIVNQVDYDRQIDDKKAVLLTAPPAAVTVPSLTLARLSSQLTTGGAEGLRYDFSRRLYLAVSPALRDLWNGANRHLWSFPQHLFTVAESLVEPFFAVAQEVLSYGARTYYFEVDTNNLIISLLLARLYKKWTPQVRVIIGSAHLQAEELLALVSPAEADALVFDSDGTALSQLVCDFNAAKKGIPHATVSFNGAYQRVPGDLCAVPLEAGVRTHATFEGANDTDAATVRLPLSWR